MSLYFLKVSVCNLCISCLIFADCLSYWFLAFMPINIFEGSMELQLYFLKLSIAMPQITADVLT